MTPFLVPPRGGKMKLTSSPLGEEGWVGYKNSIKRIVVFKF
jgi:hypothetical protein